MMSVSRMALHEWDEDYLEVSRLFNGHNQTKEYTFEIEHIEKVENPDLRRKFQQKESEYRKKYGHVRTVKVFHGTKRENIRSILRDNLDVQRHGENIGHRFGAGVSFSAFASYSSHYCDKSASDNQMLLCHVLVSNIVEVPEKRKGQSVLTCPPFLEGRYPLRYDTTAKNKNSLNVIVKFENHTFYPAFVIHFKRVSKVAFSAFSAPLSENRLSNMPSYDRYAATSEWVCYSQPSRGISPSSVSSSPTHLPLRNSYASALPNSLVPQQNVCVTLGGDYQSAQSRHEPAERDPTWVDSILNFLRGIFDC